MENAKFLNNTHIKRPLWSKMIDGKIVYTWSPVNRKTRNSLEHIKTYIQLTKTTI